MQQYIVLQMDGEDALTVINSNFTELYNSLALPVRFAGVTGTSQSYAVPADTFIVKIDVINASGAPSLNIGTSPNGTDILPITVISGFQDINLSAYFQNAGMIYFSVSGGSVNVRLSVVKNYFTGS